MVRTPTDDFGAPRIYLPSHNPKDLETQPQRKIQLIQVFIARRLTRELTLEMSVRSPATQLDPAREQL